MTLCYVLRINLQGVNNDRFSFRFDSLFLKMINNPNQRETREQKCGNILILSHNLKILNRSEPAIKKIQENTT